jgi:hypothetical protein
MEPKCLFGIEGKCLSFSQLKGITAVFLASRNSHAKIPLLELQHFCTSDVPPSLTSRKPRYDDDTPSPSHVVRQVFNHTGISPPQASATARYVAVSYIHVSYPASRFIDGSLKFPMARVNSMTVRTGMGCLEFVRYDITPKYQVWKRRGKYEGRMIFCHSIDEDPD